MYAMRTVTVKPFCTPGVVLPVRASVHDAYMAKKQRQTVNSRLRPQYQPTQIRAWREAKEMSQDELAQKVGDYLAERGITEKGYTYASIGRIERGLIPYSQPIMEGISDALGVPVDTLIAQPPPAPGDDPAPSRSDLLRLWKDLQRTIRQNRS